MREKSSHSTASCLHIYVCIYEYKCTMHTYIHVCPRGSTYVVGPMWQGVVSLGDKPPSTGRHRVAGERERGAQIARSPQRSAVGGTPAWPPPPPTEPTDLLRPASRPHPSTTANSSPPLHSIPSICSKINQLRISKCYEVNLF